MTTKFDVNETVYVPMKVMRVGMMYGDKHPEYRLRPIWKGNESDDISVSETQILNKEDVTNGKAEESES